MTTKIKSFSPDDMNKMMNELQSAESLTDSFVSQIFNEGIVNTIDEDTFRSWVNNFEEHQKDVEGLITYYYISNPAIFQSFDIPRILPKLDYKITSVEKDNSYEKNIVEMKKMLKRIGHKQLTRDIISQTIASGTLCGIWLGSKKNMYLYVFDDLKNIFPVDRKRNGRFSVYLDLQWLSTMSESKREVFFETLSPYVTKRDYEAYESDTEGKRYKELPQDRAVCISTHTLFRNQRFGIPWNTQAILDTLHKDKLKNLEKSISNKAVNSVAVMTVGEKDSTLYDFNHIGRDRRAKLYQGVRTALERNNQTGVTVISVPHWSKLEFQKVDMDGLDPKKFTTINDDLNASTNGIMNIINGKTNFSSGKLTLEIMYMKIGELLEQIEDEIYQKLFNIMLPKNQEYNYSLEYDKSVPLSKKEVISILDKLNATFGFSLKELLDNVGIDFERYVENTRFEHEQLKLTEMVKPYLNAYTQSQESKSSGRPESDDSENDSTVKTKTTDGNNTPKPSAE